MFSMYREVSTNRWSTLALLAAVVAGFGCGQPRGSAAKGSGDATVAEARSFLERAEQELATLSIKVNRVQWVAANFITEDTEALAAEAQKDFSVAVRRLAATARRFDEVQVPAELRRKLNRLKVALYAPPPDDLAQAAELAKLTTGMEAEYGKGDVLSRAAAGLDGQPNKVSGRSVSRSMR